MRVSRTALEHLHEVLHGLRCASYDSRESIQLDLNRRLRALETRIEEAEAEVRRLVREADGSDSNDEIRGHSHADLVEAEDRLSRLRFHFDQVFDVFVPFRRADSDLAEAMNSHVPEAMEYLERKISEVHAYESLSVANFAPSGAVGGAPHATAITLGVPDFSPPSMLVPPDLTYDYNQLRAMPLPPGFQWVRRSEISRDDDLRPDEGYPKVTAIEMKRGFAQLMAVVLPVISADRNVEKDHFRIRDADEDLEYFEGSHRVFEAFFGENPITLHSGRPDGYYGVHNGRHRIQVALESGWEAVPVRVV